MDAKADLMLSKQAFDELVALCQPEEVKTWEPTQGQRSAYVELCKRVIRGVERFCLLERKNLLAEAQIQTTLPAGLLTFLTGEAKRRVGAVRTALDHLDPDGATLRKLLDSTDKARKPRIRNTFQVGLDQVLDLIDRNQWGPGHGLYPESAYEVFSSDLLRFEPDHWLHRLEDLTPVRTDKPNLQLPIHVRLRLEEIYRAYLFGLWLSVLALSRSLLEYSILDNLHKFDIESCWQDRDGRSKEKKLSHLVGEVADHLPNARDSMHMLRDFGNEYLHPKKTRISKETLFGRQQDAHRAILILPDVVEALYQAKAAG